MQSSGFPAEESRCQMLPGAWPVCVGPRLSPVFTDAVEDALRISPVLRALPAKARPISRSIPTDFRRLAANHFLRHGHWESRPKLQGGTA